MEETSAQHCIKVLQIHDWVTRPIKIKLRTGYTAPNKMAKDTICSHFRIDCMTTCSQIIWIGKGLTPITRSFTIKFNKGASSLLDVMVNDKIAATLKPGQSFSTTVANLQIVELVCRKTGDASSCCEGDFFFCLHYSFSGPETEIDYNRTKIYNSDSNGNRINGIECKVLSNKRQNTDCQTYQEIPILLQGYITIKLFNKNGDLICSYVEPFSEVETFCLCYPPGSFAACEITDYSLKYWPIPQIKECSTNKDELFILIAFCLSVEVLSKVIINMKGKRCDKEQIK